MVITEQDKEAIAEKARERAGRFSLSHSEVSTQSGVNKTIVTWIMSEVSKWKEQSISDKQWRNMGYWCKYDFHSEVWKIDRENRNFRRFYNMVDHAHDDLMMIIISDKFGRGKTTALQAYRDDNPKSAFYLECETCFHQKIFLQKLGTQLGIESLTRGISDCIDEIVKAILGMDIPPVIMLDEWNDLPNKSKLITKILVNRTKGRAAFVLSGGQNLNIILKSGVERASQGIQEIFSRGGGKTLNSRREGETEDQLMAVLRKDVTRMCQVNGIESEEEILRTVNNFSGDYREVHRLWIDNKRRKQKAGKHRELKQA